MQEPAAHAGASDAHGRGHATAVDREFMQVVTGAESLTIQVGILVREHRSLWHRRRLHVVECHKQRMPSPYQDSLLDPVPLRLAPDLTQTYDPGFEGKHVRFTMTRKHDSLFPLWVLYGFLRRAQDSEEFGSNRVPPLIALRVALSPVHQELGELGVAVRHVPQPANHAERADSVNCKSWYETTHVCGIRSMPQTCAVSRIPS